MSKKMCEACSTLFPEEELEEYYTDDYGYVCSSCWERLHYSGEVDSSGHRVGGKYYCDEDVE